MFEQAIHSLKDIVDKHPWVSEVAAILPLSALIDFIDVPQKLHIHQLVSAVPLWSWPVTPSGSRLLLLAEAPKQRECVLDRYGRSVSLHGLDGRYGDNYLVSNPETVRLILDSLPVTNIENNHANTKESSQRIQNLEVVVVSRNHTRVFGDHAKEGPISNAPGQDDLSRSRSRWWSLSSWLWNPQSASTSYKITSFLGWIALLGCFIATIFFHLHIATTFLALMPATGIAVWLIYPGSPRRLLNSDKPSKYNRMVVVAEHMNAVDWTVFYGESSLVNSLLNTPLEPTGCQGSSKTLPLLRVILRVFVLGQWALAIAAAATKDWNAFFISFWIIFCNVTHGYVIPPKHQAGAWASAREGADLKLERYAMTVSSRRALLSTLVALNPDSYVEVPAKKSEEKKADDGKKKAPAVHVRSVSDGEASSSGSGSGSESESSSSSSESSTKTHVEVPAKKHEDAALPKSPFPSGAIKFLDPILAPSKSRSAWEQATYEALKEVMPSQFFQPPPSSSSPSPQIPAQPDQEALPLFFTRELQQRLCRVDKDEPPEGSTRMPALSEEWNARYKETHKEDGRFYWKKFIPEGIYVAGRIREEAGWEKMRMMVGFGDGAGAGP